MSFPRYPDYKEISTKWLGEVPAHWNLVRVKHLFVIGRGRVISLEDANDVGTYPVYSSQTTNNGCLGYIETFDFDCDQLTWTTDGVNAGTVFLRRGKHNCTNVCGTLQVKNDVEFDLAYGLHYLTIATQFYKRPDTNGAKIMNGEMAEVAILAPPLPEQTQIATYLDSETIKIDTLVAEQQRLMELLKEKRRAAIFHAVTRGLKPNALLKLSGNEWLGEVPVHWDVKRLSLFADIFRGKFTHRPRNDPAYFDGEHPFIQTGDVTGANRYITEYKQTLNDRGITVSKQFPKGTLVMTIAANIGDVAILDFPAYFPDSIVGLIPNNKTNLMFLYYLISAMNQPLEKNATVSTQMNLNEEQIGSVIAACPPLDEQIAIVANLNHLTVQIDNLITETQTAITLLQERRSALISAVVTGQIDVRNFVPCKK